MKKLHLAILFVLILASLSSPVMAKPLPMHTIWMPFVASPEQVLVYNVTWTNGAHSINIDGWVKNRTPYTLTVFTLTVKLYGWDDTVLYSANIDGHGLAPNESAEFVIPVPWNDPSQVAYVKVWCSSWQY